jgi:hypothetical protein
MLSALTIGLVLAFCLAGLYALSATGDFRENTILSLIFNHY